jgi:anionic cell wall polymer biosynthesis LytR-Cps2A-Psr (LCP) family protein
MKKRTKAVIAAAGVVILIEIALVAYMILFFNGFLKKSEVFERSDDTSLKENVFNNKTLDVGPDGRINLLYIGTHGNEEITSAALISVDCKTRIYDVIDFDAKAEEKLRELPHTGSLNGFKDEVAKQIGVEIQYYSEIDFDGIDAVFERLKIPPPELPDKKYVNGKKVIPTAAQKVPVTDYQVLARVQEKILPLVMFAHPFELCKLLDSADTALRTNLHISEVLDLASTINDFSFGPIVHMTYSGTGQVYDPFQVPPYASSPAS